jgi:hypothetical protein
LRRAPFVLAFLLPLAGAPLCAAPSAEVAFEPASVTLGDRIAATISVRLDAGDARQPTFPDWQRGWGKLSVLAAPEAKRVETPNGVEWQQPLELAAFELGQLELPPIAIGLEGAPPHATAADTLSTPSGLSIEVRSVLPAEGEGVEPAAADPPQRLPVPTAFWWTAGGFAATSAALALLLARRKRKRAGASQPTALAPLAELERALAALGGAEPVAAHAVLSLALRRFLGRTLSLPAAESTTSELAARLANRPLDRATVQRTVKLLRVVDQVKFARRPAGADELATRVDEARGVALEVERQMAPPPVEVAA